MTTCKESTIFSGDINAHLGNSISPWKCVITIMSKPNHNGKFLPLTSNNTLVIVNTIFQDACTPALHITFEGQLSLIVFLHFSTPPVPICVGRLQ